MPLYDFLCNKCENTFESLAPYDETGQYPGVTCPQCGGGDKRKVPSRFAFNFGNPEGTDRWNSDSYGHDYRFKSKIPEVQAERAAAEAMSHMGSQPYSFGDDTATYDAGIHDR